MRADVVHRHRPPALDWLVLVAFCAVAWYVISWAFVAWLSAAMGMA